MKNLNYYLSLPYSMEVVPEEEGGYCVFFPELPGCITTVDKFEDIKKYAENAKKTWFKAMLEDGEEIPLPDKLNNYSGQFKLRIPKQLHMSLAKEAKRQGISMNQYCLYLLSKH